MARDALRTHLLAGALACVALAAPAAAAESEAAAHITSVVGSVQAGDSPGGDQRGTLGEGQNVTTAEDSNCSLLVDDDALVEMCGGTSVALSRSAKGQRVVRLDQGEVRMFVEPRVADERIEIHTPTVVATILGSVVHVSHDPATDTSTVSSAEHDIKVHKIGDPEDVFTIVKQGEQLQIAANQAIPSSARPMTAAVMGGLAGCFLQIHEAAVTFDRGVSASRAATRVAEVDVAAVESGDVAVGGTEGAGIPENVVSDAASPDANDLNNLSDVLALDQNVVNDPPMDPPVVEPIELDPCPGIPCEFGGF